MISDTEGWVAGGSLLSFKEGLFYHTLDGGETWAKETMAGLMTVTAMDFTAGGKHGFAVAVDEQRGMKLLRYRTPKAAPPKAGVRVRV